MPECRRAIVFDEEMRKPGESVGNNERDDEEPGTAKKDCGENKRPPDERPDGMKDSSERLAVSQNVIGPKIGESLRILHGRDCSAGEPEAGKKKRHCPAPLSGTVALLHVQLEILCQFVSCSTDRATIIGLCVAGFIRM